MAQYYLINSVQLGAAGTVYAGSLVDTTKDNVTGIQAAGGILEVTSNATVAAQATICQGLRLQGANAQRLDSLMTAALAKSGGTGAQGAQGSQGSQGAAGAQGAQGAQG